MSVCLGTLKPRNKELSGDIEVWSRDYDGESLRLVIDNDAIGLEVHLDVKQMQELSIIIDRFLQR